MTLLIPGCSEHPSPLFHGNQGTSGMALPGTLSPSHKWAFRFPPAKSPSQASRVCLPGENRLFGSGLLVFMPDLVCNYLLGWWWLIKGSQYTGITASIPAAPCSGIDLPCTALLGRKIAKNFALLKFCLNSTVFGGLFLLFINSCETSSAPKQINPCNVSFCFWNN